MVYVGGMVYPIWFKVFVCNTCGIYGRVIEVSVGGVCVVCVFGVCGLWR